MKLNISEISTKLFKREETGFVALDLGKGYIKCVYLKENRISKFFIEKNSGQPIKLISDWLNKEGLLSKPVSIAIKGQDTLVRSVPFPKIDKKNLKEVFDYEISKFIPFNKENIYFDVFLVDENYSANEFLVLLAVVKKSFLDSVIKDFRDYNINLTNITLNNIALINLFLLSQSKDVNTAIIDVGLESTILNLMKKDIPYLSREIRISTNNLLQELVKTQRLSNQDLGGFIDKFDDSKEIRNILGEIIPDLSEEIKNSLDYFEMNLGQRVQSILLTGGLSKIPDIDSIMANSLSIETRIWNPLEGINTHFNSNLTAFKELLAVVLGLSMNAGND